MKIFKFHQVLLFGTFILLISLAVVPQVAMAKTLVCGTPGTPPCPPSGGNGGSKPGPKNKQTPVPTPIPTNTAVVTATVPPITNSGAAPSNPNALLPAVQNPGQGSSSSTLPGPLGMIIAVLIIVVCFTGGVFLFMRRNQISGNGEPGLSPFTKIYDNEQGTIERNDISDFGGNQNATLTRPDLKGSNENFTISGKNINDNSAKF
jgi:hypothetical protein